MSGINKMEIEYKFGLKDAETFDFLKTLSAAGDYQIQDKSHPLFTDVFYDTPDLLLFSLGIYLRKRRETGKQEAVWTLKQADASADDACRRREMIQSLPPESTVKDISDPAFEKMLTDILGDADLVEILTLEQDRIFKTVYKKGVTEENNGLALPENRLGDLSVDLVGLTFSAQKHTFTELEIELAQGSEDELKEFIDALQTLPEIREKIEVSRFSKFERGLILYFNRDKIEGNVIPGIEKKSYFTDVNGAENEGDVFEYDSAGSGFLLPREKAALLQIAEKEYTADPTDYFGKTGFLTRTENTDLFSRCAAVLLSLDGGMAPGFAARAFGLTAAETDEIRAEFDQNRLDMFPFVFETGEKELYYYQKPIDGGKIWTAGELAKYYGSDPAHAQLRAENAGRLFDGIGPAHGLSENGRTILSAAAQLSGIGKGISVERTINIAADIILTHPVEKCTLNDIKTLALIFVLRGIKSPTPEKIKETILKNGFFVPPVYQKKALISAAVLEMSEAVSDLNTAVQKAAFEDSNEKQFLKVTYDLPESVKEPAKPKKSFTEIVFDFSAEYVPENQNEPKDPVKPDWKIEPTDMMAVAAEKILAARLSEVEKAEPGVLAAKDIEDVHDMRVALRKMRSSNLIFKEFLDAGWVAETEAGIKKTLSGLGELRDLDVLLEKTDEWRKKEEIGREKMTVFYERVSSDRKKAHIEAVDYLTSQEYTDFMAGLKETFDNSAYLGMPHINKKGDVAPVRICDVLPAVLYEKAADITAYHEWMDGPYIYIDKLHRLRIAAKNFRYTLDFFKDCLGDAAGQLMKEFKELQDILGDFHDAVVAAEVIGAYMARIEKEKNKTAGGKAKEIETTLETLEKYKNYREEEMEILLSAFHLKWEKMDRRFFTERIAKIIAEANF